MPSSAAFGRTNPQALVEELKELLAKSIQGNAQLSNRIYGLVKEAAKEADAGRRGRKLPQGRELLTGWLHLNLAYYSLLTDHGLAFLNDLVTATENTLGIKATEGRENQTAAKHRVEISVNAQQGEKVTAPFLVENHYPHTVEASFQASDLVSLKGDALPAKQVAFDPPTLTLQPRGKSIVHAVVDVTREFKVGETYCTTIKLVGFQTKEISLLITILPASTEKKPYKKPAEGGGKSRRRRTS